MAGKVTPSPMPIAARVASSSGRLPAVNGVATVKMDQNTTPAPSTSFGLKQVAT